jgi:protein-tyrosine phosphatase
MTVLTPGELDRHLPLPGTFNVRDIGGYPAADGQFTRWRTLLRADALHQLDDEGRGVLGEIGVRTVIDLREDEELTTAPNQLAGLALRTIRRPLFDRTASGIVPTGLGNRTLQETYYLLADARPEALVGAVRELAIDGVLPALVHCTAGKDRTGMVIALTLAALGVTDEVIAADFAITGELLSGAYREAILARTAARGVPPEMLDGLLSADPELILSFLARVRGSDREVTAFLFRHGMTEDELAQLRTGLLTDAEPNADLAQLKEQP